MQTFILSYKQILTAKAESSVKVTLPFKLAGFSMKNLQVAALAGCEVPPRSLFRPAVTVIGVDASVQSPAFDISNRLLPESWS